LNLFFSLFLIIFIIFYFILFWCCDISSTDTSSHDSETATVHRASDRFFYRGGPWTVFCVILSDFIREYNRQQPWLWNWHQQ